jgi:formate transporter
MLLTASKAGTTQKRRKSNLLSPITSPYHRSRIVKSSECVVRTEQGGNMMDTKSFEALIPKDMATKAEDVGVAKSRLGIYRMLALAILAGSFIAMGANFSTIVSTGTQNVPYGFVRLLSGLAFTLGLILVVIAGAELFTGNTLIIMAWASGKVTTLSVIRNWLVVYFGNFLGSIITAYLVFLSQQYAFNDGSVGINMLKIANFKSSLQFVPALTLGIFCNALVCMAVWLCFSARTTTDKIVSIVPPIAAFVAAGFEHSVANMYFIPVALFVKYFDPTFFNNLGFHAEALTWSNFFLKNLLPVTIGNIIGGTFMVGLMYWFIYLRPSWSGKPPLGGIPMTGDQ